MFQTVDPFSFLFRKDLPKDETVFWTASFPHAWGAILRQSVASRKGPSRCSALDLRQAGEARLSISSLHQAIRALFPQVMAIGRPNVEPDMEDAMHGGKTEGAAASSAFWLLSRKPIAPQHLGLIVRAWFEAEYPRSHSPELNPEDLKWEPCHLRPPQLEIADNGTALLSRWELTHLWPQYLSLLVAGKECRLNSQETGKTRLEITETIRFRRYITAPGESGAELVSWPPLLHKDDYFSIYVRLCLQTVPFSPHPRLYGRAGLRRWVRPLAKVFLPWHENTTVVLVPPVPAPGVTGGPPPEKDWAEWAAGMALTTTHVERRPKEGEPKKGEPESWQWEWSGALAAILKSQVLHHWQGFPVPEQFCTSPPVFEEFPDQWLPALVYRKGIHPANRIQPGLNPSHRRQLMDWLADIWRPWLDLEPPFRRCQRVFFPASRDWEPRPVQKQTETAKDKKGKKNNQPKWLRPRCLLRALGRTEDLELWLEFYWQTDDMLARVQNELARLIAPPSPGEGKVTIRLVPKPLGPLGESLKPPWNEERKRREREVEATVLASPTPLSHDSPVLALIELPGRQAFTRGQDGKPASPASDPKNLLRRVFARHGRLTQFIEPADPPDEEKNTEPDTKKRENEITERIRHALLDLFRQMGVILTLPPPLPDRNLTVVGLWIPSRPAHAGQKKISAPKKKTFSSPLWVRIDSDSHQVTVWIRGEDGQEGWRPYWKALLELARNQDMALPCLASQADVTGRLENFVTTHLGRIPGEVLLLAVAQNARQVWPGLKNELLLPRKLRFFAGRYPLDAGQCPGLGVVRLRTHENDETPEWVARRVPKTEEESSSQVHLPGDTWASGVFRPVNTSHTDWQSGPDTPQVLFSIQESPIQHSRRKDPLPLHKGGWNPQMLEMTFIMLPEKGEDSLWWGTWIHRLREKSVQSTGPTILPLPLHLAHLMEEYLLDEES